MKKIASEFIKYCEEIKNYIVSDSIRYDENTNIEKYSSFITNLISKHETVNMSKIDDLMRQQFLEAYNSTLCLLIKKITFMPFSSNESKQISLFVYYWQYIKRYEINLAKISKMINHSQDCILCCRSIINRFLINPKSFNNLIIVELIPFLLSATIQLRFCIELIVEQSILNNIDKLKNNYKSHLNDKFSDILNYLTDNGIDYVVKTFLSNDQHRKEIKYFKSPFWLKINEHYQNLGKILHYQIKCDSNLNYENYKIISEGQSPYVEKDKTLENIIKIEQIFYSLCETFKDHIVSFENDKCKIIIKNFKINYNNSKQIVFFKDENDEVSFVEIKNE